MTFCIERPFLGGALNVQTECAPLVQELNLLYGRFFQPGSKAESESIVVTGEGRQFQVLWRGELRETDNPLQVIDNIVYGSTVVQEGYFALHGGAVASKHNAYLFAAPTTSGKTTLTAYLTQKGFDYVTDDCVIVDMCSMKVIPYPKPIHLREGGLKVLEAADIVLPEMHRLHNPTMDRYAYTPDCVAEPELEIGGIFFLERNGSVNQMIEIAPFEAMQELMKSPIAHRKADIAYLKFLRALANKPCKRLRYRDMEFVKDQLGRFEEPGV